jgi:hypothetical protein
LRRRALIDLEALAANLRDADADVLDARADAYGHGLALVAPLARDVGIGTLLVSTERDAATAAAAGLEVVIGRMSAPEIPDAAIAFGVDGTHRPVTPSAPRGPPRSASSDSATPTGSLVSAPIGRTSPSTASSIRSSAASRWTSS